MRIKSVLVLSAFSAATFFSSIGYSADSQQAQLEAASLQIAAAQQENAQPAKKKSPSTRKHRRHHHSHSHHHHYDRASHRVEVSGNEWSSNFLVGGELGYALRRADFTTSFTAPNLGLPITGVVTHEEKIVDHGTLFGVLGGWQARCNRYLLGLEANVDFANFEKTRSFLFNAGYGAGNSANYVTGTALYDRGDAYSLSLRAGYFITSFFMPYVRVGGQYSRDELSYQAFIGQGTPALSNVNPPNLVSNFVSKKKDVFGGVLGIGAEFPTYIGASTIRFEYNFIFSDSFAIDEYQSLREAGMLVGTDQYHRPTTHVGKVAWVWNFV